MDNTMFKAKKNEERTIVTTCTKVIDGRTFVVRVFFPVENAETIQDKIERMLHRNIVNAVRQNAA